MSLLRKAIARKKGEFNEFFSQTGGVGQPDFTSLIQNYIQSGASSQAKHGGAYFSAVFWSIKDLLAAPGPYESPGPPFLGGSA